MGQESLAARVVGPGEGAQPRTDVREGSGIGFGKEVWGALWYRPQALLDGKGSIRGLSRL